MQTFNIMLDIGGDNGNQVPKRGVSPAEIAVLIAIHGDSAVHDIDPQGDKETVNIDGSDQRWTNRVELDRLRRVYGRAKDGEDHSIVGNMFPGMAARVFETIDELALPEEFFKPTARAFGGKGDHDGDGKTGGSKKGAASTRARGETKAEAEADEAPVEVSDDGIDDMPDSPITEPKPAEEALFG